jgi:hypothetical protein
MKRERPWGRRLSLDKEKEMVSIILPLVLIVGFLALSLAYLRD